MALPFMQYKNRFKGGLDRKPLLFKILYVLIWLSCASCIDDKYIELLNPPGFIFSRPVGINNKGDVIGVWFNRINRETSFLYRDGKYTRLLPPGWKWAEALYINDNGEVAGNGYVDDTTSSKGFLYSNGQYTELLPPGWNWATTNGLNDNGEVVGFGEDGTTIKLFLYSNGQYAEFLPPLPYFLHFRKPLDINNHGTVVGTLGYANDERRTAFIYKDGAYTALLPPGSDNASALHIDDNGVVLIQSGTGPDPDVLDKYYIYRDGEYIELRPPGLSYLRPTNFSDSGAIIGQGSDGINPDIKFIYKDGEFAVLSPPGLRDIRYTAINDNGMVFGWGLDDRTQNDKWFIFNGKDYTVSMPPQALKSIKTNSTYKGFHRWYVIMGINNSEEIIGYVENYLYIPLGWPSPISGLRFTFKQRSFIAAPY